MVRYAKRFRTSRRLYGKKRRSRFARMRRPRRRRFPRRRRHRRHSYRRRAYRVNTGRTQGRYIMTRRFQSLPMKLVPTSAGYQNVLSFNCKSAFDSILGNEVLLHHQTMYDEFRVVKVTQKIWMNSSFTNSTGHDHPIPNILVAYDPDAGGRAFAGRNDFLRVGAKPHFMKPYRSWKLTLRPKVAFKTSIPTQLTPRSSPFMDMSYLKADGYFPNGVQYMISNMNALNDFETQYYYTYQFRGLRNGQAYSKMSKVMRSIDEVRIIPEVDSQNEEVMSNFEGNFEHIEIDNTEDSDPFGHVY